MLAKSLFIGLEHLKPESLSQGLIVREILEIAVCYQIKKQLTDKAYSHLRVSYCYDPYKLNANVCDIFTKDIRSFYYPELATVNVLLIKAINESIEEFNIYNKNYPNTILNFNSCLVNKSNYLLTCEILKEL